MKKIYIIDASGYLYSSYFAIRNMTNHQGESTNALYGFIRSLLKLIKDFQPTHLVVVFDGPNNSKKREEIYPEYKAHRSATPQDLPYQIEWAREFCKILKLPVLNIPEVEADDSMGSVAIWAKNQGAFSYLCTSDKDMSQIVDSHILLLNTRKDNLIIGACEVEQMYGVPPSQMIDFLSMTGDASDNIPGLPGIGPKTATALLKEFGSLDEILAHSEKISGKKRTIIMENSDKALISKQLVKLDLNVSIPKDQDFYRLSPPDIDQLKQFYRQFNFNSLINELEKESSLKDKNHEIKAVISDQILNTVDDAEGLKNLMNRLSECHEICFTVLATDTHPMKANLLGIYLGIKKDLNTSSDLVWFIPTNQRLGLVEVLKAVKPLFENVNISFFGYDVKFGYQLLYRNQIEIKTISFDVFLASYLLNAHHKQHSLKDLALYYFNKSLDTDHNTDVHLLYDLKEVLENELKQRGLEKLLYEIELPLLKVLAQMEQHGIFIDLDSLQNLSKEIQMQISQLKLKIYEMAGEEFNINSPKQLSQILQEKLHIVLPKKTATGFSTNVDVLEELKNDYPIASFLLNYRSLEKLRSTYLDSLPTNIDPHTHRIHCVFNQSVTATGRLSCQDPNLQNIPNRTLEGLKIREAFRPQLPGWTYLSADYSQIELRLLAHFSEDPTLLSAFNNNEDIHTYTAATVLGIPLRQVTKEMRNRAKAVNFGIIYGQQAFGLAKELHIDVKVAADFINTYFNRYPRVKEYIETCKACARSSGRTTTITGRERLIPEINHSNHQLKTFAERLAVNTPLQGTAADLIKLAMLRIDKLLFQKGLKGYLILQIHDELIFEIPDDEIDIFIPLVKEAMQNVFELKVPLIVDIALGKNWKECYT